MLSRITSRIMLLAAMAAMMVVLTLSTVSPVFAGPKTTADFKHNTVDLNTNQQADVENGSRGAVIEHNGPFVAPRATSEPSANGKFNKCYSSDPCP